MAASAGGREAVIYGICRTYGFAPANCEGELNADGAAVKEKKYTQEHEWIEVSEDRKTCTLPPTSRARPVAASALALTSSARHLGHLGVRHTRSG